MNNAEIKLSLATNDARVIAELNDWAVNTVREYATEMGYDANALYSQEVARITTGRMSLDTYRKCSRAGSKFRMSRRVRRALWVAAKTRKAFAALNY